MSESVKETKAKPTVMSGFPEWLPEIKILENQILQIIRTNYELFGFVPIETPAVERIETLTSKGGNEKEIYSLSRLAAEEGADPTTEFALHFDLTVPLARYVAQHYSGLVFPFRRYQIQKVWRGERPQSGRFREFYQCDIDVIGDGELSLMTDAEIPSIIFRIFKKMKIGHFVIRINNRKILQGLFLHYGLKDKEIISVMRIIDKLEKIGTKRVFEEIKSITSMPDEKINELIDFISMEYTNNDILAKLELMKFNDLFIQGAQELISVFRAVKALGVPDEYLAIDIRIARGLDYYTGTIYETVLLDYPGIGSICSGGRYDNLASHFTDKKLPGVGISIGITRLLSRLIEAKILQPESATVADVLVTVMDEKKLSDYLALATTLREEGINTEVYLETSPFKAQMKYANRKKFKYVIIAGEDEFAKNCFIVKNMITGDQKIGKIPEVIEIIKQNK